MNYAVRLSFPAQGLASWFSRVALASEKCIFYEHASNKENVHIHGLIFGWSKDKKTLKDWVKETLRLTPVRTQWSFKESYDGKPVDDGFIKYMTKGKYDPVYVKGFSVEFIAEEKAKGFDAKKNNDERLSKNDRYWNDFRKWVGEDIKDDLGWTVNKFEVIRRWSYCYMMNNIHLPMPHDIARMKACTMKLAWELEVPLPDKDLVYKY